MLMCVWECMRVCVHVGAYVHTWIYTRYWALMTLVSTSLYFVITKHYGANNYIFLWVTITSLRLALLG